MPLLEISGLFSKEILGGFQLQQINFTQHVFDNIAIIGETGSGKSTLLKTIAGLIQPLQGEIFFNEKKVKGPDWQLVPGEKGIAYLSQHFELRHNYKMQDLLQLTNEFSVTETKELFALCKVDTLLNRNSKELSGGEKQRLALAKLLLTKPQLLILDEPFSNIDLIHKSILKKVIADVCKQYAITCILTSHDPTDVLPWANKIMVMQHGKIIQQDTAQAIYHQPINEYTAALLGSYNISNGKIARPKELQIDNENGIAAKVVDVRFLGLYWELDVECSAIIFTSYSKLEHQIGQEIMITKNSFTNSIHI